MLLFKEQVGSYIPINEHFASESQDGGDDSKSVNLTMATKYKIRRPFELNYLNIYLGIITTILCVLVVIDIRSQSQQCLLPASQRDEFETTYGWNPEYMTLSHSQDHLWEEDLNGGEEKVIELGDDGQVLYDVYGQAIGSPASISM